MRWVLVPKACKFDFKIQPWFHHPDAVGLFQLCRPEDEQSRMNEEAGKV